MKLSEVTGQDGVALATLLKVIAAARFDGLTGTDIEAFMRAKQWLHALATQMAEQLQGQSTSAPTAASKSEGMKIKAMGPIGASSTSKKKRK